MPPNYVFVREKPRRKNTADGVDPPKKRPIMIERRPTPKRKESAWSPDPKLYTVVSRVLSRRAPAPPERTRITNANRDYEFKLIRNIGEGGQGRCDLFKRLSDSKLFVYKLMKTRVEVDDRSKKPKEAMILMDILAPQSARIIKLYFWAWQPKQTVYYLEYCDGGDLAMLIKNYTTNHRQKIPESFIWHAYIQLAEALAFLQHGYSASYSKTSVPPAWQPIVHRDIKPHNIFLRKPRSEYHYPDLVLADFGMATRQLVSCEGRDDFCGSLAYQGPELPKHSMEGDAWAVGACLHHMAIGNPPILSTPCGWSSDEWLERKEARQAQCVRVEAIALSWRL